MKLAGNMRIVYNICETILNIRRQEFQNFNKQSGVVMSK